MNDRTLRLLQGNDTVRADDMYILGECPPPTFVGRAYLADEMGLLYREITYFHDAYLDKTVSPEVEAYMREFDERISAKSSDELTMDLEELGVVFEDRALAALGIVKRLALWDTPEGEHIRCDQLRDEAQKIFPLKK